MKIERINKFVLDYFKTLRLGYNTTITDIDNFELKYKDFLKEVERIKQEKNNENKI